MFFRRRPKQLAIGKPCQESWEAMDASGANRFCAACNRSVHDLSVLTRRQAAELFDRNAGKLCGRISYDERGNPVFAKERSSYDRLLQISVLGASVVASAAAAPNCGVKVQVTDPSGAVVPNATVKISNAAAPEAVTNGATNSQGEFSGSLAPGLYSVLVGSPGFMPFQQKLVCIDSETVTISPTLGITLTGDVVEVRSGGFHPLRKLRSLFHRA